LGSFSSVLSGYVVSGAGKWCVINAEVAEDAEKNTKHFLSRVLYVKYSVIFKTDVFSI